jgi:hypothetical protein
MSFAQSCSRERASEHRAFSLFMPDYIGKKVFHNDPHKLKFLGAKRIESVYPYEQEPYEQEPYEQEPYEQDLERFHKGES